MAKYQEPKEPVSTKSMLMDLANAKPALHQLKGVGKVYDPLIEAILLIQKEEKMPTARKLQQQCNITSTKLKIWLEQLYQDFLAAIESRNLLHFAEIDYYFVVSGLRDHLLFRCSLPATPRVGDNIDLGFISGATGSGTFYVDNTHSEYCDNKISVYIYLKAGYYDPYFHQLRAQARFEGRLPFSIEQELSEYELKDFLRDLYAPPRAVPAAPVPGSVEPGTGAARRRRRWN